MQALLPTRPKAACVAMTMGASLMYIRSMEFSSLAMDERLEAQRQRIDTDALTGVLSRHAYTQALSDLENDDEGLPGDLVAFVADINGLKQVNDTLGHDAGDELIIGAANCLEAVFGNLGRCYRTGGDEFVVLAMVDAEDTGRVMNRLESETERWRGRLVSGLTLSCGHAHAADCEGATAAGLVREADIAMYAAKAEYYSDIGRDRRRR
jgi:diguanylate cyclase (GGDEF)-like protein